MNNIETINLKIISHNNFYQMVYEDEYRIFHLLDDKEVYYEMMYKQVDYITRETTVYKCFLNIMCRGDRVNWYVN